MTKTTLSFLAATLFGAVAAPAQVQVGDIAISGFSTDQFGIATPPSVTGYTTGGFGGGTSQAILHDPTTFLDFIVGGFGFIGRATITGPGTSIYSVITTGIGTAAQMSWDGSGNIIVADAGVDQVRMVSPAGVVTDLSIGAQPWSTSINAGAFDPFTGDVIVGNNGGLYRLASGATVGTLIVNNLGGFLSNVQFDPNNGDILATVLLTNRLIRVDSAGVVTDLMPPGTVASPNALQVDGLGNYLLGAGSGEVWRVDAAGAATLIATNTSPGTSVSGLAYVRGGCSAASIGVPCPGPGGPTFMTLSGSCELGNTFVATSGNHTSPAVGVSVYGVAALAAPLDLGPILGASGCNLYISPDVLVGGLTNGAGEFVTSVTTTAAFAGQQLYLQHAVLEGATLNSFTTSNGYGLSF